MTTETPIEAKFHVLKNIYAARNEAIQDIRAQIMALEKEMELIAEPYESEIQRLQEELRIDILAQGKSFKCEFGKATYKKEYERHSWDDKALMGYAAVNPVIEQFRKVTTVPASVSLSVGGIE